MFVTASKRPRDEEADGVSPNSRRWRKKPRPLALKHTLSLHSKFQLQVQSDLTHSAPTLTPAESSEDEDSTRWQNSLRPTRPDDNAIQFTQFQSGEDGESDLEMVDSTRCSDEPLLSLPSAKPSPMCCEDSAISPIPSSIVNQSLNVSGGRTATPIYSDFMGNMPFKSTLSGTTGTSTSLPLNTTPASIPPCKNANRDRRLPSPISEDEDISDFPQEQLWSTRRDYDQIYPAATDGVAAGSPVVYMVDSQTMQLEDDSGLVHRSKPCSVENTAYPTSSGLSVPKSGPQNEYVNSAAVDMLQRAQTMQGLRQKKASIAMGFRADCDKCQRRVPGHYSHIVYS